MKSTVLRLWPQGVRAVWGETERRLLTAVFTLAVFSSGRWGDSDLSQSEAILGGWIGLSWYKPSHNS